MRQFQITAIGILLATAIFSTILITHTSAAQKENPTDTSGFAVLELFTSEGCSSCPAADALLAKIRNQSGNRPVFVLAYHVDYWNRLGWKDQFSDPAFSQRQYQYSQQLGAEVYTPQLVVNGRSECIGSDESAIDRKVEKALSGHSNLKLDLSGTLQQGKARIKYQIQGNPGASQLVLAIVQRDAVSTVRAGENKGRTLAHAQIVRNLQSFDLMKLQNGEHQIDLPAGFNSKEWEVIGMLQDPTTGAIGAAAHVTLN